jgi:hypothetical protein
MLTCQVTIETSRLSLNVLPSERMNKHALIEQLFKQGQKDKEIAETLNDLGILSPRGKQYYAELVSVTRAKMIKREKRRNQDVITIREIDHFFIV